MAAEEVERRRVKRERVVRVKRDKAAVRGRCGLELRMVGSSLPLLPSIRSGLTRDLPSVGKKARAQSQSLARKTEQ